MGKIIRRIKYNGNDIDINSLIHADAKVTSVEIKTVDIDCKTIEHNDQIIHSPITFANIEPYIHNNTIYIPRPNQNHITYIKPYEVELEIIFTTIDE